MGEVVSGEPAHAGSGMFVASAAAIPHRMLSQPGEPAERRARARASDASSPVAADHSRGRRNDGAIPVPATPRRAPRLPSGTPISIAAESSRGRSLSSDDAASLGGALNADLGHVRLHTDPGAARLADETGARAFTIGSHIFFGDGEYRPDTAGGADLLHHELAHVAEAEAGPARLYREVKVELGEPTIDGGDATGATKPEDLPWERLQVETTGMDDGVKVLSAFAGTGTSWVYIGLHPQFVKVYDSKGNALGARVPMKAGVKVTFYPGVYDVAADGSLTAVQVRGDDLEHLRHETDAEGKERSVIGSRELTPEEQKKALDEMQKDDAGANTKAATPKQTKVENVTILDLLTDPDKVRSMVAMVPGARPIYFVPKYVTGGSGGKGNGTVPSVFSSPIEGRGDGQPPNAPPWPITLEGPKLVPSDSRPSFTAKVEWSANGNYSLTSQVISQVGSDIHYRWELFDITQYAKAQLTKDPAHAKADATAAPEKSLDERIDEFTHAKAGSGTDVTGMGGANREFEREFEDWWKDTERATKRLGRSDGMTAAERLDSDMANLTTIELAPVSLLITALGASLRWAAELFSGPTDQQEVEVKNKGIFLIRAIATPAIGEDLKGQPVVRPPSVAGHVIEVSDMTTALNEALDEPGAQLAELQAQIDIARKEGKQGKVDYLESLMAKAKLNLTGSPLDVLAARRKEKNDDLERFGKDYPSLSDYSRQNEVGTLDRMIALYGTYEGRRTAGAPSELAPAVRMNAALISEVTGQQYPLLLAAGPMPREGDNYHWLINDVTNLDGADEYEGVGATPSQALQRALDKFGGKASYGRGSIAVRTAGLGLEKEAPATLHAESQPVDWAVAQKRIDDLVTVLAALGLIVASGGTAAALIGAAAAAARIVQRWQAGKLSLDGSTISDVLGMLGGLGAAGQLVAGLQVAKLGRAFTILEEAGATEAKLAEAAKAIEGAESLVKGAEVANKIIGGAGVIWGDVAFIDQMMSISAQEESGSMTHAEARRARAGAISSAVQNNGLFIAGEAMQARARARANDAAQAKGNGAGHGTDPARAGSGEKATPDATGSDTAGRGSGDKPLPQRGSAAKVIDPKAPAADPYAEAGRTTDTPTDTATRDRTDATDTAPADGTARTVPIGERRATPQELREALPPDLRDRVVFDDALHGDHVRAEWDPDADTGLVSNIRLRVSPDAVPSTVRAHADTIRTMEKFQGLSGRVRMALNWIAELIGVQTLDPTNKPLFDAQLEVQKLPKLIKAHMDAMQAMEPNARTEAEAKLDSLEHQLMEHLAALSIGELTPSSGVSQRGTSKAAMKKYAELLTELRKHDAGTDRHREIRWEMYQLDGGEKPYETWRAIYASNVSKATKANEIVAAEKTRLGWAEAEKTVDLPGGETRRLDLFNPPREGAEVKAYDGGTVYASEDILSEVRRDGHLVKRRGWTMTWMFIDCEPSGPLLESLGKAGITVELRTKTATSSRLSRRIQPPALH